MTINGDMVVGTHTDFPGPVHVPSPGHVKNANGYDTMFTDASGVPLSHEIESYNSGTGELWAWVNVPLLAGGADTLLYLYYGNASIITPPSASAVWDSGYGMVQHMNTNPTATRRTARRTGTTARQHRHDSRPTWWTPIMERAFSSTGATTSPCPARPEPERDNCGLTVSAWVNLANASNNQKIIGKMDAGDKQGLQPRGPDHPTLSGDL